MGRTARKLGGAACGVRTSIYAVVATPVWVLLLTWAAMRTGGLPRALNHWVLGVGLAGICTIVPMLSEVSAAVFGLSQIVWFFWLGVVLLRDRSPTAAYETTATTAWRKV
jgi:hypothetical protein